MRASAVAGILVLLTTAVLVRIEAVKVKDGTRAEDNLEFDEEDEEHGEISTSLKVGNVTLGGKGAKIVTSVVTTNSTSSPTFSESRSGNASRELMVGQDKISKENSNGNGEKAEELPEALELRYARPAKYRRRPYYSPTPRPSTVNRRNVYGHDKPVRSPGRATRRPPSQQVLHDPKRGPTESECTFFSKTVCLEAVDYPMEAIMRSIRSNKEMVAALLTDFEAPEHGFTDDDEIPQLSSSYKTSYDARYDKRFDNRFETSNEIKRKYEYGSTFESTEERSTCPSQVKYAQPQLARAASGVWKYIINTGEHSQTVRLEKCLKPQTGCNFISENYRSACAQVYNYQRLLTWDSKVGLHMDIFKVPSCCSCQVLGYTELFPPHQSDPPLKLKEPFPGVDFVSSDHHLSTGSSHVNKYANSLDSAAIDLFRNSYGINSDPDETQLQHSSSSRRPSIARPPRPRKPSNPPRPYDKVPQQHAPNTRAPGYKGQRPHRPNRPFRRESTVPEVSDYPENTSNITINRYGQALEHDNTPLEQPTLRLQTNIGSSGVVNSGNVFDDEYLQQDQQQNRRVNYNYHPIQEFFMSEAAMLKSEEPMQAAATSNVNHDSWTPIFKP